MASVANAQLGRELASIVGDEFVCDTAAPLTGYAIDGVRPATWVIPQNANEVAAIVRVANERRASIAVAGGFTKQSMGGVPAQIDILLRTDRLNRVLHYDPGDLTIGVESGCRIGDVVSRVGQDSLLLPLDVPRSQQASIGGVLASAAFGPLKHNFGGVRDYCIGISFVTGDGKIAKAGGRVVKNVAGYDVMKLMIGSQGTLGVIIAANFKLFAAPKQTRTFIAEFEDYSSAIKYRDTVRTSPLTPLCFELISPRANAYFDGITNERYSIVVRASGSDTVLARYRKELGGSVSHELAGVEETRFWQSVQDFGETVQKRHQNAMVFVLHLAPATLEQVMVSAEQCGLEQNLLFCCVGRASVASMVCAYVPLSVDPPAVTQFANAIGELRKKLPPEASAIVLKCPREAKAYFSVWGEPNGDLEAMRAVKQALDPNGVLNPGRFLF